MMMLKSLKNQTLPIAMLVGAVDYSLFIVFSFLAPYLIFMMLLLTFRKVSLRDLKPKPLHAWLLLIQIGGALAAYLLLYRSDKIVVEGVMVCVIYPTVTVAVVITSKLGSSAASLTTYILIVNIGATIVVPVLFPLVEVHLDVILWEALFVILSEAFPLLICPFLVAWLLSKRLPRVHQKLLGYHEPAFYLWAVSSAIVIVQMLYSLFNDPADGFIEIMIAIGALVACCLQFLLGKTIGSIYNDRINGGQALGQRNTTLTIWMAHTYPNLLPVVTPGSYVLQQNIINSWQSWKKRKIRWLKY